MKNKIAFQNEKYTVLDISTDKYINTHTIIDTFNYEKIIDKRLWARSTSGGKIKVSLTLFGEFANLNNV